MQSLSCSDHFILPFFPLILMNSICKMLVFWTRNAFRSILARHCVGRHIVKSHSCFFFKKDWKSGRVTLHREFELELTALLVTQFFIYSDVWLLVSSYLLICLDDFHSKVVSKIIIFYYWWGYQCSPKLSNEKKKTDWRKLCSSYFLQTKLGMEKDY